MTNRPKTVTVIGWLCRVGGIGGMLFAVPYALWGPQWFGGYFEGANGYWQLPPILLFLVAFLSSLLFLLCGNGILKGRNWARVLVVSLCLFAVLSPFFFYEVQPILWLNGMGNLACGVVLWYYLFRHDGRGYFGGGVPGRQGAAVRRGAPLSP